MQGVIEQTLVLVLSFAASAGAAPATRPATPDWVAPMQKVHARHAGDGCYVAQFGDSITYSMAFWSALSWHDPAQYLKADDSLPKSPTGKKWQEVLSGMRDKGREHGNFSGWRTGDLLKVLDNLLLKKKPAIAIVMIGTNDIAGGKAPANYRKDLETIVGRCIDAGCVPILNTIPPRKNAGQAVADANEIIRQVAVNSKVPLVDYHAAIVHRQPEGAWAGTLISDDGVHPTGGKTEVMTEENLKVSGYALRTWVNFLAVREVYFRVIAPRD